MVDLNILFYTKCFGSTDCRFLFHYILCVCVSRNTTFVLQQRKWLGFQ